MNEFLPRKLRPAVLVGVLSSAAGGVVLGAMTGPVGLGIGFVLGALCGMIIGLVIEGEEHRSDARTRELDEIIGSTTGDMSAGPVSLVSQEAEEHRRWAEEWLTPPPPPAMSR
ncbi:MAG TPA: hypothetical protein VH054_07005 [Polyangiaceae bacterium]|jgi:hypothetical protein|nr:hypothetical protein [Polyangiaceae bacterium]